MLSLDNFRAINLQERELYFKFWQEMPIHSIDYTLANIWGWQQYFGLEWQFTDNLCWIRQTKPEIIYWNPVGNWQAVDLAKELQAMQAIDANCKILWRVPELFANLAKEQLADKIEIIEDRGQWEYLYKQSELATLAGRAFHKKKNHYNAFIKEYGQADYRPLTNDLVEDVLVLQDTWCQWHECEDSPTLIAENEAINRVLSHWEMLPGLVAGGIYINDKITAFSVGEDLGFSTLAVHFEKALAGYKGIYQAINHEFSRIAGDGFTFLNRAQDLDEEGMRQAKLSYNPADFVKKYRIHLL